MNIFDFSDLILVASAVIIAWSLLVQTITARQSHREERRSKTFALILHLDIARPDILGNPDLVHLAGKRWGTEEEKSLYMDVLRYLNLMEVVAIGIKEGFYDETILNEYMGAHFIRTYRHAQAFIEEARRVSNNPKLFIYVEAIARRWEGETKRGILNL